MRLAKAEGPVTVSTDELQSRVHGILSPSHGELTIAFSPEAFAKGRGGDPFARAELLFEAIAGQGARLPSQRRFAARARAEAHGIRLDRAEHESLKRMEQLELDAV